ncbi:MAG: hypothetical protein WA324_29225, partial [Bryobacteraceae bacterium]
IWEVDQQSIDGQLRPPLLSDPSRWRRIIFDSPSRMSFQRMDESFAGYAASINLKGKTLTLTDNHNKNRKTDLVFERIAPDRLTLDGNMDGHKTHMQLKLIDRDKYLLVNRPFHWIQESPFNR